MVQRIISHSRLLIVCERVGQRRMSREISRYSECALINLARPRAVCTLESSTLSDVRNLRLYVVILVSDIHPQRRTNIVSAISRGMSTPCRCRKWMGLPAWDELYATDRFHRCHFNDALQTARGNCKPP